MDKKRLLELAGINADDMLNEAWGEGFEQPGSDDDDMDTGAQGGDVEDLRSYVQRAARRAHHAGVEKPDFDRKVLDLVDDVWSRMQSVRKRGDRVGNTPRY